MKNKVQLITYVDRLSGGGFNQLNNLKIKFIDYLENDEENEYEDAEDDEV